jgi:hypothetical protein
MNDNLVWKNTDPRDESVDVSRFTIVIVRPNPKNNWEWIEAVGYVELEHESEIATTFEHGKHGTITIAGKWDTSWYWIPVPMERKEHGDGYTD